MPLNIELIESQPSSLMLSKDEADLLASMGRKLASNQVWWGGNVSRNNRSVIDVRPEYPSGYIITFREVIGVVQIGNLRIRVKPKIPWEHFIYIASRSEFSFRHSTNIATFESGFEFMEMLCRWFINATERLVRLGLRKEYSETDQELSEVRGQLQPFATAVEILKGRPVASCTFDELSQNSSLNRIVRAGCERVTRLYGISDDTKRRARRLMYRMDDVDPLLHSDRRLRPDRLSKNYIHPISLAHLILDGCGISLADGKAQGTSFLLRTPEIIEDGIRSIIAEGMPHTQVKKERHMLGNSDVSMNPDIVFGERRGIADIKYKLFDRDWNRADFNQVVTFAVAFESQRCVLLGFVDEPAAPELDKIPVGRIEATRIVWPVGHGTFPEDAARGIIEKLNNWLNDNSKLNSMRQS